MDIDKIIDNLPKTIKIHKKLLQIKNIIIY